MGPYFNNRPLYGNHNGLIVLCGDRPLVKFGKTPYINGQMMMGLQSKQHSNVEWFHDVDPLSNATKYASAYTAGKLQWNISSRGVVISWTVAPLANGIGFATHIVTYGAPALRNMSLVLAFGGAYRMTGGRPLGWTYDGAVNPSNLAKSFSPSTAKGNTVVIQRNSSFTVAPRMSTVKVTGQVHACGCVILSNLVIHPHPPRHHHFSFTLYP